MEGEEGGQARDTQYERWLQSLEAQWSSLRETFGDQFSEEEIELFSQLRKWRKKEMEHRRPEEGAAVELAGVKLVGLLLRMAEDQASDSAGSVSLRRAYMKSLPVFFNRSGDRMYKLDLNGCHLGVFPPLENWSSLRILCAHGNNFKVIPKIELPHLQTLDLADNKIEKIMDQEMLSNLTTFMASSNQLREFPAPILQWSELVELRLGSNQISCLPESIGELKHLQTLWLDNNRLSSLPAEIGQLRQLEILFLNGNELTSIPAEISSLGKLEVLWLNYNRLSTLPVEIGQLRQLKELLLMRNELTSIPAEIASLGKLKVLDVCENPLLTLPTVKNVSLLTTPTGGRDYFLSMGINFDANSSLYRPKDLSLKDKADLIHCVSATYREFEKLFEKAKKGYVSSAGHRVIDYYNKNISKMLTMEEAALQMLACSLVYLDFKLSTYHGDIEFNVIENVRCESVSCYAEKYEINDSIGYSEGCVAFHLVPQGEQAGQKANILLFQGTKPKVMFPPTGIKADLNSHAVGKKVFTSVQEELQEWIKEGLEKDGDGIKLVITGHSLGGALATHAFASIEEPLHRQNNVKLITFNAPGVDEDTIRNKMCGGGVDVNLMKGNICMVRHEWDIVHYAGRLHPPGTVLYTRDLVDEPLSSLKELAKSKVPVLEQLREYLLRYFRPAASPPPLQDLMEVVSYAHTVPAFVFRQMHGHRLVISKRVEHNEGHLPDGLGKVFEYVRSLHGIGFILERLFSN